MRIEETARNHRSGHHDLLTETATYANLSDKEGSIATMKDPSEESPSFLSVTEELTLATWVVRSILRETLISVNFGLTEDFPKTKDAIRKAEKTTTLRKRQLILRCQQIHEGYYVESPQSMERGGKGKQKSLSPRNGVSGCFWCPGFPQETLESSPTYMAFHEAHKYVGRSNSSLKKWKWTWVPQVIWSICYVDWLIETTPK